MHRKVLFIVVFSLVLAGCSGEEEKGSDERRTAVTVADVESREIQRVEVSIGRLEANAAPAVAAETAGRVSAIHRDAGDEVEAGDLLAELDGRPQRIAVNSVRAEIKRLEILLANERKRVVRLRNLAERQSVAQDQLDDAETAVASTEAQLEEARSRLEDAVYNLERTQIVSPVTGRVQSRMISAGDFVSPGRVLFEMVASDALRALLPLPEHLQDVVAPGQPVELAVPARPDETLTRTVSEIRPMVGERSSAIELIVDLDNPGGWRPGGSVTGRVILEQHEGLVVPPRSVVRRPAGSVVYVVDGDQVFAREVATGLRGSDWIEIAEGLEGWETVVVDGAGFLTDGARINIQEPGERP